MKHIAMIFSVLILISCGNDNYNIVKEENIGLNNSNIEVILKQKVNTSELETISNEIRNSRADYDKIWIAFYLAEFPPESGIRAWAMGSFTPNLEVEIFGEDKPSPAVQKVEFPKYVTVIDMLNKNGDYVDHNFEVISESPLHVRVSTDFVNGDSEKNMIEQTKRDIIYVAFQAFAGTDIQQITVTSFPIIRESFNPNLPYDGQQKQNLKQTKTITREQALAILEKYIKTKSFNDLYQLNGTLYLPNDKFNLLKSGQLENVFNELK
tara:strand:- start:1949 stop:2746 length:798 start_codon:yes stop_codon:yes gene_type:complete